MWAKGNLHCHTTVSDGDFTPNEACKFFADHGYSFLAITDHNAFVDPRGVDSSGLLLIPGEELTMVPDEDPSIPIHVNALGIDRELIADIGFTRVETIQKCIDVTVENGGIAQINHPNFYYAFDDEIIAQTSGALLLEIYNAHPLCYNEGDETHKPVEEMWDNLLSSGKLIYGTGVDDSHHYTQFAPNRANPNRAWIWARVGELTVDEVLSALRRGDFYASSGVELADMIADKETLQLVIRAVEGLTYRTEFIGSSGKILAQTHSLTPGFTMPADGSTTYVRARITASNGTRAWTQPMFIV